MATISQKELRLATYQKYERFQEQAALIALDEKTTEMGIPLLKELGAMLAQWRDLDEVDSALITTFNKLSTAPVDSEELTQVGNMLPFLFCACGVRDGYTFQYLNLLG